MGILCQSGHTCSCASQHLQRTGADFWSVVSFYKSYGNSSLWYYISPCIN